MAKYDDEKLNNIIQFILHKAGSREQFQKLASKVFHSIGDENGKELKNELTAKFKDKDWKPPINDKDMVELAYRLDFGPLYHAIARRFPKDDRKDLFPDKSLYEKTVAEAAAPTGEKLTNLAKFISNPKMNDDQAMQGFETVLHYLNMKQDDVVKSFTTQLHNKNTMGLDPKELEKLADRVGDPVLKKAVFQNLGPNEQKSRADLAEDEIQDKKLSMLDQAFVKYVLDKSGNDLEKLSAELQVAASKGNADYLQTLQSKLDAKDLMILAQKILSLGQTDMDAKEEAAPAAGGSFTSTVNTAPYAVPIGSAPPWMKRKKKQESDDKKYDASVKGAFDMLTKFKGWIPKAESMSEDKYDLHRLAERHPEFFGSQLADGGYQFTLTTHDDEIIKDIQDKIEKMGFSVSVKKSEMVQNAVTGAKMPIVTFSTDAR